MADIDYEIIIDNPTQFLIQLNEQGPAGPAGRDGEQGEPGVGINSIVKARSEGLVDVYVITYSNGATQEIRVTNGSGISSIEKTSTEGLVDTYTIYYTNGENTFFNVTNGQNAVISGASATVDATVGTPSVEVVTGGTQFDRTFQFNFHNLKGEKGDKGDAGGAEWGNVNGDISDQQDLMNLLGGKQDTLSPIEPIYIGQDVLYPAIEPTTSASYYQYNANKSIPITSKSSTLEDGAEFNHLNSIPFEFDKVYKLPTGSADNIYGYDVLGLRYKFGKYNSTLDKVVPIASFGKMTTQIYRLPSDNDGDVEVNASSLVPTSNTVIGDISGVSSSNMYVQKVNTSTGIKLYIYGKYNYISSSGGLRVDTIATVVSDASGSTAFTDLMKECTFLTECNQNSNHDSYQSIPYYEIEGTLDAIIDTSSLGVAKYFSTTREAEYGEYGIGVRYDGNKIVLDANNKLTVNESALSISSDVSNLGDEIDTINSKISSTASSTDQLQSLSDVQQAILDGIETCASNSLDDLTNEGEARLHALKAYSDNGEVLTDKKALSCIKSYAHSSFDSSKFTVAGSAVISDNGIASNFSANDWVNIPNIDVASYSTWEVFIPVNLSVDNTTIGFFSIGGTGAKSGVIYNKAATNQKLIFYVYVDSTTTLSGYLTREFDLNKEYILSLGYNGSKFEFKLLDSEYKLIDDTSVDSTVNIYSGSDIRIGLRQAGTPFTGGSSNLKKVRIIGNGVEIFSGNKTGIDTIKPDNYTVVGTPTISADGIASGLSDGQLIFYQNLEFGKKYKIIQNLTVGELTSYTQVPLRLETTDGTFLCNFEFNSALSNLRIANKSVTFPALQLNDNIVLITDLSGSDLSVSLIVGANTYNITTSIANYSTAKIMTRPISTYNWSGSIDLNAFKIYVDGNLIYQPCLKIPYTESKTGSKVVNSVYRDRVNDMAEQFGSANYYTLDEDNGNFTLPQVELYGLIEKAASTVPSGVVQSSTINNIVSLTQAEYDALTTKDSNTFYVIIPST